MRLLLFVSCVILSGCAANPSMSEQGFLGQSAWHQQRAAEDAQVIMQGMNRARAESESYARLPNPLQGRAPQIPAEEQVP